MEGSQKIARKDTTSSSFFFFEFGPPAEKKRNNETERVVAQTFVPRLGGAWDHPVTLGFLSPRLGGGKMGGSEAGGLKVFSAVA